MMTVMKQREYRLFVTLNKTESDFRMFLTIEKMQMVQLEIPNHRFYNTLMLHHS